MNQEERIKALLQLRKHIDIELAQLGIHFPEVEPSIGVDFATTDSPQIGGGVSKVWVAPMSAFTFKENGSWDLDEEKAIVIPPPSRAGR